MTQHTAGPSSAAESFRQARRQAAMEGVLARLTGRSVELLSFDDVCQKLKLESYSKRELRDIPLDSIVGSAGRYHDFSRTFLPRQDSDQERWAKVKEGMTRHRALPPIDVYQIGEAYFVLDGNHRVSVARHLGETHMKAYVTTCKTKVTLRQEDQPDDLMVKAEYADFLEASRLDEIRPEANLQLTVPGQYWKLETHIEAHHYLMSQNEGPDFGSKEAVADWYDQAYLPVVYNIREQGLLRDFPDRTETDLYLWIFEHRSLLEKKLGWHVELETAAVDLAAAQSKRRRRMVARVEGKLLHALTPDPLEAGPSPGQWRQERVAARPDDRLFAEILVPIGSEAEGWYALDLALAVAQKESSKIFGLHIVSSAAHKDNKMTRQIKAEFERRCQVAGIPGELSVDVGKVVGKICERARWADLIVMFPAHPPGSQFISRFTSGSRNVIYGSCRPVLTVPAEAALPLERVLLAYDGSPKAREGLYVAAYLAEQWGAWLVVTTVIEDEDDTDKLAQAHHYLQSRGITATYVPARGDVAEAIVNTANQQDSDLTIIGGYGVRPMREAVLGSKVDEVLRESQRPVLVCR